MQLITSIAFLVVAATGVVAQLQINTPPSVVECQPTQLQFGGGTPPYFLSILPGGQIAAAAIETLPTQTGNSFTWNADIASGTSITFQIKDSTGSSQFSAIVTVQAGQSTACVGKNSLSSGSGSATASSGGSTASGAPASTTAPGSVSNSVAAPASSASSVAGAAPSVSSGSAAKPTSAASSGAAGSGTGTASAAAATKTGAASALNASSASGIIAMILAALLI